jgi:hypothetical protein
MTAVTTLGGLETEGAETNNTPPKSTTIAAMQLTTRVSSAQPPINQTQTGMEEEGLSVIEKPF